MTTVQRRVNVGNVAIEGTFDDCRHLVEGIVRQMYAHSAPETHSIRCQRHQLGSHRRTNSVPRGIRSASSLGGRFGDREDLRFLRCSHCGNFPAATFFLDGPRAGWACRSRDSSSDRNRNDIVARFLEKNDMSMVPAEPLAAHLQWISRSATEFRTVAVRVAGARSPSPPAARCAGSGENWPPCRCCPIRSGGLRARRVPRLQAGRRGHRGRDPARLHDVSGYLADPHTAIGIAAARAHPPAHGVPTGAIATAHPAKFPDAIEQAIGIPQPRMPARLADLMERPERFTVLPSLIWPRSRRTFARWWAGIQCNVIARSSPPDHFKPEAINTDPI